jgi:hypothetical protein
MTGRAGNRLWTYAWWAGLCAVSLLNAVLWWWVAELDRPASPYRSAQLVLSGIYVAVCGFRSFFPRIDLERRCLWDTPLSSIFLGRSLATVAEIAFIVQCALFVDRLGASSGLRWLGSVSTALMGVVLLAEVACWYAVLTLDHLGHAIEETLWALMVLLLAASFGAVLLEGGGASRAVLVTGMVSALGAGWVMVGVDVPMYLVRRREARLEGVRYLSLRAGLADSLLRRRPTRALEDWRPEMLWMTTYFSIGVWLSLALVIL